MGGLHYSRLTDNPTEFLCLEPRHKPMLTQARAAKAMRVGAMERVSLLLLLPTSAGAADLLKLPCYMVYHGTKESKSECRIARRGCCLRYGAIPHAGWGDCLMHPTVNVTHPLPNARYNQPCSPPTCL